MCKQPRTNALRRACLALGASMLLGCSGLVDAATVDISTMFRPSPGNTAYRDTTPVSGFCLEYGGCGDQLRSVVIPIQYDRTVRTGLPAVSRRWSLHTPPQATVTLTSDKGHSISAAFQITHIAQVLTGQGFDKRENPASHTGTGGNCSFAGAYASGGGNTLGFIWRMADPITPGLCYPATSGANTEREITVTARSMSVGYQLVLPRPQAVKMGLYHGSVTFSIGEAGDFALGSQVSNLSDSSMTFNFTVDVQHQLNVVFSPGWESAELLPPASYGGWHQYLTGLKPAPGNISKEQTFMISVSGPMTVYVRCDEWEINGLCLLRNVNNQVTARMISALTLPPALVDSNDQPLRIRHMRHDRTIEVTPKRPVVEEPGLFRMSIETMDFKTIMLKNPGYPFRGAVTLVFDAQL